MLVVAACLAPKAAVAAPAPVDYAAEAADVGQWRANRLRGLKSETGWLTLVGLYWLEEGETSIGRGPKNAIRLGNPRLASIAGSFMRTGNSVRFVSQPHGGITHEGKPVSSLELVADTAGKPTILEAGSLSLILIERAGQYAIRARDSQSPTRREFKGLDYFPVSTEWVFDARFEPYAPGRSIRIVNILGMEEAMACPGAVVFSTRGREYRLDAVLEDPAATELFVMFADETSGKETYGAGRFLYLELPKDGTVRVDFNKAYNPPCAFSNFATCPLPPSQNRLPLRIEAGEKTYGSHQ
jgi:uncharacterized protein (DUF1684 family)